MLKDKERIDEAYLLATEIDTKDLSKEKGTYFEYLKA